jgi:hypothetical protein
MNSLVLIAAFALVNLIGIVPANSTPSDVNHATVVSPVPPPIPNGCGGPSGRSCN